MGELSKMQNNGLWPYASQPRLKTGHGWNTPLSQNNLTGTLYCNMALAQLNPFEVGTVPLRGQSLTSVERLDEAFRVKFDDTFYGLKRLEYSSNLGGESLEVLEQLIRNAFRDENVGLTKERKNALDRLSLFGAEVPTATSWIDVTKGGYSVGVQTAGGKWQTLNDILGIGYTLARTGGEVGTLTAYQMSKILIAVVQLPRVERANNYGANMSVMMPNGKFRGLDLAFVQLGERRTEAANSHARAYVAGAHIPGLGTGVDVGFKVYTKIPIPLPYINVQLAKKAPLLQTLYGEFTEYYEHYDEKTNEFVKTDKNRQTLQIRDGLDTLNNYIHMLFGADTQLEEFPSIVFFGRSQREFMLSALLNKNPNMVYWIKKEGEHQILLVQDLSKGGKGGVWRQVGKARMFVPDNKPFLKKLGLWQDNDGLYKVSGLAEVEHAHEYNYYTKLLGCGVNPRTHEIEPFIRPQDIPAFPRVHWRRLPVFNGNSYAENDDGTPKMTDTEAPVYYNAKGEMMIFCPGEQVALMQYFMSEGKTGRQAYEVIDNGPMQYLMLKPEDAPKDRVTILAGTPIIIRGEKKSLEKNTCATFETRFTADSQFVYNGTESQYKGRKFALIEKAEVNVPVAIVYGRVTDFIYDRKDIPLVGKLKEPFRIIPRDAQSEEDYVEVKAGVDSPAVTFEDYYVTRLKDKKGKEHIVPAIVEFARDTKYEENVRSAWCRVLNRDGTWDYYLDKLPPGGVHRGKIPEYLNRRMARTADGRGFAIRDFKEDKELFDAYNNKLLRLRAGVMLLRDLKNGHLRNLYTGIAQADEDLKTYLEAIRDHKVVGMQIEKWIDELGLLNATPIPSIGIVYIVIESDLVNNTTKITITARDLQGNLYNENVRQFNGLILDGKSLGSYSMPIPGPTSQGYVPFSVLGWGFEVVQRLLMEPDIDFINFAAAAYLREGPGPTNCHGNPVLRHRYLPI
ncbi:MAG: hypothetical protein NT033_07415 [Candidatus Omnitrophica bacterium]|nr:hypothetical protein [Candidatus Omnitrophota bacterium]